MDLLDYSPGLKLWIDDVRNPPDETWEWVTTSDAAIATLKLFSEEGLLWIEREAISFDHDLGGDDTSRPVVIWMIENKFKFKHYAIHSTNQTGIDWLRGMINRYLIGA